MRDSYKVEVLEPTPEVLETFHARGPMVPWTYYVKVVKGGKVLRIRVPDNKDLEAFRVRVTTGLSEGNGKKKGLYCKRGTLRTLVDKEKRVIMVVLKSVLLAKVKEESQG